MHLVLANSIQIAFTKSEFNSHIRRSLWIQSISYVFLNCYCISVERLCGILYITVETIKPKGMTTDCAQA